MTTLTLRPKTFKPVSSMIPLSKDELKCLESLRTVTNRGPWGHTIKAVVMADKLDVNEFRKLICELLSQTHDDSEVMLDLLGIEAFDSLVKLQGK